MGKNLPRQMSAQGKAALPHCGRSRTVFCRMLRPFIVAMALVFAVPGAADDFGDAKQALEAEQHAKAIRLLRPMAEKGDSRAQHLLGYAHMSGLGVKRSDKKAQYWLMKAAAQDYTPAIGLLGQLLVSIDGSPTRGLPLMKIAVRRGDAATQAALGMCYLFGVQGIPADVQESKRLLLLSASQKHKFAYLGLAWWHATDRGGKKPDYVEVLVGISSAIRWVAQARATGDSAPLRSGDFSHSRSQQEQTPDAANLPPPLRRPRRNRLRPRPPKFILRAGSAQACRRSTT
ncbi:MAG: tetratricopeptide repeat protein [Alphaproteobacteria bacterium]